MLWFLFLLLAMWLIGSIALSTFTGFVSILACMAAAILFLHLWERRRPA